MHDKVALVETSCPHCQGQVVIEKRWSIGLNSYGGWVMRCALESCKKIFALNIGRDVYESKLLSGASLIKKFQDNPTDRAKVLSEFGVNIIGLE
jgi:hypothetical protein